ncbi:pyroglutamyl-peptidase I [Francisella sp. LA112445]|uniref:pyroglutamyl-peptidase I n=1 Tax=Francisella sp. LA112445 TaxID=1395624 RepID=UPI001788CEBF|nr:pyroglutamyl-peptidase I [Francisella sp. LA112445]QIW09338.1 pyroglutamyl-peptidase I [Francisella sp. LA112445]
MKKVFFSIFMFLTIIVAAQAKTVLVTGFTPFGGESINSAWQAVKNLPDKIDGVTIVKKQLPVSFKSSTEKLDSLIKQYNPDIIIDVGEAGGRSAVSLERVAINVDDARIPDNDNNQPIDKKISKTGKNAYFTKLPIYKIQSSVKKQGIPVHISNTAGTFVCNHVMYHLLELLDEKYPKKIGGFIHVPYTPAQVVDKSNTSSMSSIDATQALIKAIQVTIKTQG